MKQTDRISVPLYYLHLCPTNRYSCLNWNNDFSNALFVVSIIYRWFLFSFYSQPASCGLYMKGNITFLQQNHSDCNVSLWFVSWGTYCYGRLDDARCVELIFFFLTTWKKTWNSRSNIKIILSRKSNQIKGKYNFKWDCKWSICVAIFTKLVIH